MDQSEFEANVCNRQARKTHASEARLVLVLLLIGWESGANFGNQSQSAVKQNQSKRKITFDTSLKSALYCCETCNKQLRK